MKYLIGGFLVGLIALGTYQIMDKVFNDTRYSQCATIDEYRKLPADAPKPACVIIPVVTEQGVLHIEDN